MESLGAGKMLREVRSRVGRERRHRAAGAARATSMAPPGLGGCACVLCLSASAGASGEGAAQG